MPKPRTWPCFAPRLCEHLAPDDDLALWEAAVDHILGDAEFLLRVPVRQGVLAEVGRCSHWLRPHQSRWAADGGFAWPCGYGGSGYSLAGLPEFDWSCLWRWDPDTASWVADEGGPRKRCLVFRVALPARTGRHPQAAAHALWTPGPPGYPRREFRQLYGFRKKGGRWLCTAYQGDGKPYERATEGTKPRTQVSEL
jgi:hypothetical protein